MSNGKILTLAVLLFVLAVIGLVGPAKASQPERILDFRSEIRVHRDGSMTVTENIRVVCAGQQIKRGIFREIPTKYKDRYGNRIKVGFEVLRILRDGHPEGYHIKELSNGKSVYIGQENVFLKPGEYTYTLTYKTNRQLGFFKDFDELYWNVTGNGWDFVIDNAEAVVALPPGAEIMKTAGYTGRFGKKGQEFETSLDEQGNIVFTTTRRLLPREGLTIAVAWPKGIVIEPTILEKLDYIWKGNRSAAVGVTGLVVLLVFYVFAWFKVGKDPEKGTIIPLFSPPKRVSPASTRLIMRMGSPDDKLFAVAVVNMAVKGYLTIKEDEDGEFTLEKTGAAEACLSGGEAKIARKLFGFMDRIKLEQSNHDKIGGAKRELQKYLMKDVRNKYIILNSGYFLMGLALTIMAVVGIVLGARDLGLAIFMAVWLSGWTFACFFLGLKVIRAWRGLASSGRFTMRPNAGAVGATLFAIPFFAGEGFGLWAFSTAVSPLAAAIFVLIIFVNALFYHLLKAPTLSGRRFMDEVEGYRLYLSVAEQERLNILNPPEKTPDLFEKHLPYALALDVEHEWSEQFASVLAAAASDGAYRPSWYAGRSWRTGDMSGFASSLGKSFTGAISSASTAPGSSSGSGGGGFSGGGGGGGGGGGW
jgi:uncharacterized membrane protein YgcG